MVDDGSAIAVQSVLWTFIVLVDILSNRLDVSMWRCHGEGLCQYRDWLAKKIEVQRR